VKIANKRLGFDRWGQLIHYHVYAGMRHAWRVSGAANDIQDLGSDVDSALYRRLRSLEMC